MSASDFGWGALIMGSCAALLACATTEPEEEALPAIAAGQLARQIESFKGRNVRTCGQLVPFEGSGPELWAVLSIKDPHRHGASVNVVPCPGVRPRLDANGCIAGRIAYRDGTLDETRQTGAIVMSSAITSYVWYLHAQCPARL